MCFSIYTEMYKRKNIVLIFFTLREMDTNPTILVAVSCRYVCLQKKTTSYEIMVKGMSLRYFSGIPYDFLT